MPWFRTFIRGENFKMRVEGKVQALGFYTNRFVEADDQRGAELAALAAIKAEPKLQGTPVNERADPPRIYVEEIEEMHETSRPDVSHGLMFFREDE